MSWFVTDSNSSKGSMNLATELYADFEIVVGKCFLHIAFLGVNFFRLILRILLVNPVVKSLKSLYPSNQMFH
jgi:hypothetical protein